MSNLFRVLGSLQQGDSAFEIKAWIKTSNTGLSYPTRVLIDSGATGNFADETFVDTNEITKSRLASPIPVWNADGTENQGGPIENYIDIWLQIQPPGSPNEHSEQLHLEVTQLANDFEVILGLLWLQVHNPSIDWQAV